MQSRAFMCAVGILAAASWIGSPQSGAADLVQAPQEYAFYELSNLRVEKGITGDQIAFDYKRTREGKGVPVLAGRTDTGDIPIRGFGLKIEATGTIHLEDRYANLRSSLNRSLETTGVEFYFTMSPELGGFGTRYLASNSVRHGAMNTSVQARPPSPQELAREELLRKSRVPPPTAPPGHDVATKDTLLVPGAPVLAGVAGEWKPAKIVSLPNPYSAKVMVDGQKTLLTMQRANWLAVSPKVAQQMRDDPDQFSITVRTLPGGNLLLGDDLQPLQQALPDGLLTLAKGTPLVQEKYSQWVDVYFLSSDNITARVLIASTVSGSRTPREERVPVASLAIRDQTLQDLQTDAGKQAFAANVANYQTPIPPVPPVQPGMSQGPAMSTPAPFPTEEVARESVEPEATTRTWKDQTGNFSLVASLDHKTDTDVFLKRDNGVIVKVPIAKLSDADQEFLTEDASADADPFSNVVMSSSNGSGPTTSSDRYRRPLTQIMNLDGLRQRAKSMAISPDRRFLLMGQSSASATLREIPSGQVLIDTGRMEHMGDITACGFSPDGRLALLGGGKGIIEVYQIDTKGQLNLKHRLSSHSKEITCLAFSRDGKFLLSGGADNQAKYWDLATGREIKTLAGFDGKIKATCIAPSGDVLMATDGKTLQKYSVDKESIVQTLNLSKSPYSGQCAAFSPNGLMIAVNETYDFRLWNLQTGTEMNPIKGSESGWTALFAPDSQHLMTGGNGVVNIWDTKTQSRVMSHPVGQFFYVQTLAISSDGTMIACPSGHPSVGVYQESE